VVKNHDGSETFVTFKLTSLSTVVFMVVTNKLEISCSQQNGNLLFSKIAIPDVHFVMVVL
jgi:hypothetical protein